MSRSLINRDLSEFYHKFHAALDLSYARDLLKRKLQDNKAEALTPIGEGSHFSAFRYESRLGYLCVLSVGHGKGAFSSSLLQERFYASWHHTMQCLPKFPLLPPFVLLKEQESYAWVQPFGALQPEIKQEHWEPLDKRLSELKFFLFSKGIAIDDTPQIRYWRSVPFICDLSGLRLL